MVHRAVPAAAVVVVVDEDADVDVVVVDDLPADVEVEEDADVVEVEVDVEEEDAGEPDEQAAKIAPPRHVETIRPSTRFVIPSPFPCSRARRHCAAVHVTAR